MARIHSAVCRFPCVASHATCMLLTAGLEPHSALPTALPMMFNRFCRALPSALRDIKVLATSAVRLLGHCLVHCMQQNSSLHRQHCCCQSTNHQVASCSHGTFQSVQSSRVITRSVNAQHWSRCLWYVQAFYLPATKHPWWWLGIRPIDKRSFSNLLKANNSVVLVPGGVSECMVMKQGQPTLSGNQHALLIPPLVF